MLRCAHLYFDTRVPTRTLKDDRQTAGIANMADVGQHRTLIRRHLRNLRFLRFITAYAFAPPYGEFVSCARVSLSLLVSLHCPCGKEPFDGCLHLLFRNPPPLHVSSSRKGSVHAPSKLRSTLRITHAGSLSPSARQPGRMKTTPPRRVCSRCMQQSTSEPSVFTQ